MGQELGTGYITVVSSTKGLGKDLRRQFTQEGNRAGEGFGEGASQGTKKGMGRFGKIVSGVAKAGGVAVLAGAGALAAKTFTAGLDRYMSIENAQAKLGALGHDTATVEAIMDNALAAVKGTSFGMGEAADVAAAAVASGIQPGQELESTLTTVANAAAIAGVDMGAMGAIFNKAAASGKVQGDILAQLGDMGIPIVQWLAEELGVTAEEVYKLGADGKIDFETFQKAMQSGMDPDAAVQMGDTLGGSAKNAQAALGRLGAEVMDKVGPHIKAGLDKAIEAIDWLTEKIEPAVGHIQDFFDKLKGNGDDANVLTQLWEDVRPLFDGIKSGWEEHVQPAMQQLQDAWAKLDETLRPIIEDISTAVSDFFGDPEVKKQIEEIGNLLSDLFGANMENTAAKIETFATALQEFWDLFGDDIINTVENNFQGLLDFIEGGLETLNGIFDTGTALLQGDWEGVWQGIKDTASGIWEMVKATIGTQLDNIATMLGFEDAKEAWDTAWQGIKDTVAGIGDWFAEMWQGVKDGFADLGTWFSDTWQSIADGAGEMIQGVKDGFTDLGAWFSDTGQTVWDGITTAASEAWDSVSTAVSDAWDSITTKTGETADTLKTDVSTKWDEIKADSSEKWTEIKDGIGAAWDGIKANADTGVNGVKTAASIGWQALNGDTQGAWERTKGIIGEAWANIDQRTNGALTNVKTAITNAWNTVKERFRDLKDQAGARFSEMRDNVTNTANNLRDRAANTFNNLRDRAANSFNTLRDRASNAANNMRDRVANTVSNLRDRATNTVNNLRDRAANSFNNLRDRAANAAGNMRDRVANAAGNMRDRAANAVSNLRDRAGNAMSSLRDRSVNAARTLRDNVVGAFNNFKDRSISAFRSARDGIGRAWDGIKEKAKSPVRFVVNTVYTNGIKKAFDKIAGAFGMGKLPSVSLGFASGGIMPGYTPGRDVHSFVSTDGRTSLGLSGGEGILRPEVTAVLGKEGVDTLNAARSKGSAAKALAGLVDHMHFAGGGIVNWRGGRFTSLFASRLQMADRLGGGGMTVTQGGWRPATSYSGTSHAGDAIDIAGGGFRRFIGPLRSVGIPAWDRTGKGNWVPHVHAVPLPGAGVARGSAAWQAQDYLRGGDGLGGRDNGPRGPLLGNLPGIGDFTQEMMDLFMGGVSALRDMFSGALGKIKQIQGTAWGDMIAKIPGKIVDGIIDKAKEKIPGFLTGGYAWADGPAWLSEDGRPELVVGPQLRNLRTGTRVFDADETAALLGQGRTEQHVHIHNPSGLTTLQSARQAALELIA